MGMDPVNLGGSLGESVQLTRPKSFAIINDLVTAWTGSPSRVHLSRLCAASIGVCVQGAPRYNVVEGDPVAYGALALDWFMGRGVPPSVLYSVGPGVLHSLALFLPKEQEVEEIADFTEAKEERSTG